MAHQLDFTTGRAAVAYTKETPWHLLGDQLEVGAPIERWIEAAGLNWTVLDSPIFMLHDGQYRKIPGKKALFRSDTGGQLSVVSDDFKVVHPKEVVEFFRDLVDRHDMQLSTAGALFDGRRFWALAELGKDFEAVDGDKVEGNLLLTTAVDGSLRTTARFVSTRVVCNNTLNIALAENVKNLVQVSHRSQWDPEKAKMDLGLIDTAWDRFTKDVRRLVETPISTDLARGFFMDLLDEPGKDHTPAFDRKVENLMELYTGGRGADMSVGTLWGVVNAATEAYTYGSGRRDPSHQFWDSFYAGGADMKDKAFSMALELAN